MSAATAFPSSITRPPLARPRYLPVAGLLLVGACVRPWPQHCQLPRSARPWANCGALVAILVRLAYALWAAQFSVRYVLTWPTNTRREAGTWANKDAPVANWELPAE